MHSHEPLPTPAALDPWWPMLHKCSGGVLGATHPSAPSLYFLILFCAGEVQAFYEDLSGRQYVNEVFNFSVDKLYDLLFTDSPFQRDFMEQRRFSGQFFQGQRLPSLPFRATLFPLLQVSPHPHPPWPWDTLFPAPCQGPAHYSFPHGLALRSPTVHQAPKAHQRVALPGLTV